MVFGKTQVKSYSFLCASCSRKVGFPAGLHILTARKMPASVIWALRVDHVMQHGLDFSACVVDESGGGVRGTTARHGLQGQLRGEGGRNIAGNR